MTQASSGGNKHWALMVDEATKYKKSLFLKKKNDQIEVIIEWLKELKNKYIIKVQWIRMDNAGENKMLARHCDPNEMGIKFEYTAPGTPQQKQSCRKSIGDPHWQRKSNDESCQIYSEERQEMWCEAAQTASMLDNVLVQEKGGKPPHTKFLVKIPSMQSISEPLVK